MMNVTSSKKTTISQLQRIILLLSALLLAIFLFFVRGGIKTRAPLEQLARQSLNPESALSNGRPTVIEFYADWCEACQEMAPAMLSIKNEFKGEVDFVLLNVDNNLWKDLIDEYSVRGIPQLNFFDINGVSTGRSIGLKRYEQIRSLTKSFLNNEQLPSLIVDGKLSKLENNLPI